MGDEGGVGGVLVRSVVDGVEEGCWKRRGGDQPHVLETWAAGAAVNADNTPTRHTLDSPTEHTQHPAPPTVMGGPVEPKALALLPILEYVHFTLRKVYMARLNIEVSKSVMSLSRGAGVLVLLSLGRSSV